MASAERPHLGFRSFWTPSRCFAERFGGWVQHESGLHAERLALYRAEVPPPDTSWLALPFPPFVSSTEVLERAEHLAAAYQWVTFYEGIFEGSAACQAVYLGRDPVAAENVGNCRGR